VVSGLTPRPSTASAQASTEVATGGSLAAPLRLPKVSVMQWAEGINIHIGSQEGAINRRANILVSVELLDGGKLRGFDSGTRSEHNLFSNYSTEEEATWKNRWSGTWVLLGDSLRLDLRLDARECKKTKTATGAATEKRACQRPSPKLRMECTTQHIELESWSGPPETPVRQSSKQEVWGCSPADSGELGETPSRWVLAKQIACVQVNPGRGRMTYSVCPPLGRGR
jgi:hypothetical protein